MNATMLLMARANAKAAKYTKYCVRVAYGILCHCGNFSNDIFYERVYKYHQGRSK